MRNNRLLLIATSIFITIIVAGCREQSKTGINDISRNPIQSEATANTQETSMDDKKQNDAEKITAPEESYNFTVPFETFPNNGELIELPDIPVEWDEELMTVPEETKGSCDTHNGNEGTTTEDATETTEQFEEQTEKKELPNELPEDLGGDDF